jgi:hypothetical protein
VKFDLAIKPHGYAVAPGSSGVPLTENSTPIYSFVITGVHS